MKKFMYLLFALPLLFAACQEPDSNVDKPQPQLNLSTVRMEFLAEGGEASIDYTIDNPISGVELSYECEADWIEELAIGEDKITFTVAKNVRGERTTTITFKYDTITKEVSVKQYSDGGDYETSLTLEPSDKVTFGREGGQGLIKYTLKNPIEGVALEARCEAAWISDITITTKNINFIVAANNTGDNRSTTLVITYDTLSYEIAIEQSKEDAINTVELHMDWATRVASSEFGLPNNYFCLTFGDNNELTQFALSLVSNEGSDVLKGGVYTPLTEDLLLEGTQLYIFTEGDKPITFINGRATVEVEENIYKFDIYLSHQDGTSYHITYEGEVSRMGSSNPDGVQNFVPYMVCAVAWWEPGNFSLQLYINMAYCHELDMYDLIGNSSDYLAEGVYTLAPSGGNGKKQYINSSWAKYSNGDGTNEWLADAEIEIKHNNKRTTTIKGFLKTESGIVVNIDWTGVVEGFDLAGYVAPEPDLDYELTASHLKGDYFPAGVNGNSLNNYNFTLSDTPINRNYPAPGSVNFNFDLYSDIASEDNTIPNGTYTFDATNSKAAGTACGKNTLGFKVDLSGDKHSKDWKFVEGSVVVSDGNIEALFTTDSGKSVTLHYNGDLTLRPYSPDNNYDAVSRLYKDVTLNITDATIDAYNSGNWYNTDGADNWTVTLFENESKRDGVVIALEFFADKSVGGWDFTYKAVAEKNLNNKEAYMNAFLAGYLIGTTPAGSWYKVLDADGNPTSEMAPIVGGTIDVKSNDDGTKTITFDCVDDAGYKITGSVTTK